MDRLRRLGQRKDENKNAVGSYGPLSPVQNGSGHVVLPGISTESVEGFICPTCHANFVAMNELISHVPNCKGTVAPSNNLPLAFAADIKRLSNASNGSNGESDEVTLKVNGYDALKEGNELLRQELHSSHKQQQSLSEQIEKMRIENDAIQRKLADQERAMHHLKTSHEDGQFERLAKERSASKAEMTSLQGRISDLEHEKKTLQAAAVAATATHQKALQDAVSKHESETASLRAALQEQKAAAAKLSAEFQKAGSSASSTEKEVSRLRGEVTNLTARSAELTEEVGGLRAALATSRTTVEKRDREIQEKNSEVLALFADRSKTEGLLAEKTTERDDLRKRLEDELDAKAKLEEAVRSRTRELEQKSNENSGLAKQLDDERVQAVAYRAEVQELRKADATALQEALHQLSAAERENHALAAQIDSTNSIVDSGTAEVQKLKQQLEEMTSKIQSDDASTVLISQLKEDKLGLEKQVADAEVKYNLLVRTSREDSDAVHLYLETVSRKLEVSERSLEEEKSRSAAEQTANERNIQAVKQEMLAVVEEKVKMKAELEGAVVKSEAVEREREALREQLKERSSEKATLASELKDLKGKLTVLESANVEQDAKIQTLMTDKESLQQSKADLKQQIITLQNREESLTAAVSTSNDTIETLRKEVQELESGHTEARGAARVESEQLQAKIAELESAAVGTQTQLTELQTSITQLEDAKRSLAATLQTTTAERDLTLKEKRVMSELVSAASTDLDAVKKQHNATTESYDKLKVELDIVIAEKKKVLQGREALEKEIEALRKGFTEKDTAIGALRQELQVLSTTKESELNATVQKLATLEQSHEHLQKQISASHAALVEMEEKSGLLQSQLVVLLEEKTARTADFAALQAERTQADLKAAELNETLTQFQVGIDELLKQVTEKETEVKNRQTEIENIQVELETTRKEVELNAVRLDERNGVIHNLLKESEKAKSEAQKVQEDLRGSLKVLEHDVTTTKTELDRAREEAAERVRQMALLKTTSEAEDAALKEKFTRQESTLQAKLDQAKAAETEAIELIKKYEVKVTDLEAARETAQRSLHQLQTERNTISARIGELEEEKRISLTRCVELEGEKEKLQTGIADIRRKYEDSLAAMHELGRENQSLQVECARLKSRKWAMDEETFDCAACGKAFGLTQRKHHCRSCGEIFCNDCSSKTASLVASRKPVRVCDSCFVEIQGRM